MIVDICEAICYVTLAFGILFWVVYYIIEAFKDVVFSRKEASVKKFIVFYKGETRGLELLANSLNDLLILFRYAFELAEKDFVVYSVPDFDCNVSDWVFEGIFNKNCERIY